MSDVFDGRHWEELYRTGTGGGGRRPNAHLLEAAADLRPGLALDAGCGEGADSLWLAARGWRVTAVDFSGTAIERARARALELGPGAAGRIDWIQGDLMAWRAPAGGFDLVTSHYVHTPEPPRELVARLAGAVAPGGTLLFVGHAPTDEPGAAPAETHLAAGELASWLDPGAWEVLRAETLPGRHGHGHGPPGEGHEHGEGPGHGHGARPGDEHDHAPGRGQGQGHPAGPDAVLVARRLP